MSRALRPTSLLQRHFCSIYSRNLIRCFSNKAELSEKLKKRVRERPPPIHLTEHAAKQIQELIATQPPETKGIRLSLRTRGCNGLTFTINYANEETVQKNDVQCTQKEVTVFVDSLSLFHLIGTVIDYVEDHLRSEFTFNNPNAKGSCGCGESFNV